MALTNPPGLGSAFQLPFLALLKTNGKRLEAIIRRFVIGLIEIICPLDIIACVHCANQRGCYTINYQYYIL